MKILVVEDEKELADVIVQSLEKEQFVLETAHNFNDALDKIIDYDYDCILLDIMLPGGNGIDLLKELKNQNKTSNVIIISANNSLDDKLKGLDLGADDYLTKPFHIAELNARIRSVLRRKSFNGENFIELANVKLDINNHALLIDKNEIPVNRKEFDILTYFMSNTNRMVSKNALAEHVWGDNIDQADDFDFIYSQIKNIRKKLKDNNAQIEIQSVYGVGYRLTEL
ncbi:MAG: response regulator transcription factor [Crocinitomicaceae bacterium]